MGLMSVAGEVRLDRTGEDMGIEGLVGGWDRRRSESIDGME